jgi:hypothetical protein
MLVDSPPGRVNPKLLPGFDAFQESYVAVTPVDAVPV